MRVCRDRPAAGIFVLCKLYLQAEARGLGLASQVLAVLKEEAKAETGKIQLTVNRFNADSIAVYRKWGFVTVREEKRRLAAAILWTIISWSWIAGNK